jgi:hypothetical protein
MAWGIIFSAIMQALIIGSTIERYPAHNVFGPPFVAFVFASVAYWIGLLFIVAQQKARPLTPGDRVFIWLGYPMLCLVSLMILDWRRREMYGVGIF